MKHLFGLKTVRGAIFCICALLFCSCGNDGLKVEKFIKRVNAREINAASIYVYPADHASLYFFNDQVLEKNPNLILKLVYKKDVVVRGQKAVAVKIQCKNVSNFFVNYMRNLDKIDASHCIIDTIFIRETRRGDKISFSWSKIKGENLYLASVLQVPAVTSLNIHADRSENSPVISKLTLMKKVVIDEYSEDPDWVQCFTIDHTCRIVYGYIKKSPALLQTPLFFTLTFFQSLSFFVALFILFVIFLPIIFIRTLYRMIFRKGGSRKSIIFLIVLFFGLVYVGYQLLEKILFELFLINLPY